MRSVIVSDMARRNVRGLIERWALHDDPPGCLPVPIEHVVKVEGWRVTWASIYPVMGFAIVAPGARTMCIDSSMSVAWQRITMAHELGHLLAAHAGHQVAGPPPSARHECSMETMLGLQEIEATLLGAAILVPRAVLDLGWEAGEVARRCGLPIGVAEGLLGRWHPDAVDDGVFLEP